MTALELPAYMVLEGSAREAVSIGRDSVVLKSIVRSSSETHYTRQEAGGDEGAENWNVNCGPRPTYVAYNNKDID